MAGARHAAGGQPRIVPRPTELRGRGPLAKETDLILLPTASSSSPTAAAGGRERGGRTRRGRREGREGDSRRLRRTRGYSDTDDTSHRSDVVRVRSSPKDDTRAGLGAAPVRPLPGDLLVLQRVRRSRHESVPRRDGGEGEDGRKTRRTAEQARRASSAVRRRRRWTSEQGRDVLVLWRSESEGQSESVRRRQEDGGGESEGRVDHFQLSYVTSKPSGGSARLPSPGGPEDVDVSLPPAALRGLGC